MRQTTLLILITVFLAIHGISQQPTLVIQQGHRSRILFDDINKKEAAWLTVDEKEAFLWNIPTGRQLKRISLPNTIRGAALVNDGEEIAIAAYDFTTDSRIHFFNARTGEKTGDIEIADNSHAPVNRRKNWQPIDQLIRNRDGSRVILRSFNKLYIADVRKKSLIGEYQLTSYDNQTGLLSNDHLIVAGLDAGKLILVKSDLSGTEIKRVTIEKNSKPICLEIHPDLPVMALGFKDGSILIIDEELQVKKEITQGAETSSGAPISDLSFNYAGNILLISNELSIYQCNLNNGETKKFESKFASGSRRITFCPTDENAILISSESIPYQLEWSTGKKLQEYYVNSPGIGEFFFNAKEDRMISGSMELNLSTGSSRKYVEFDPDERILLPISDSLILCSFKKMEYIKEESVILFGVRGRNIRTGKIEFSVKLPFKHAARYGAVSLDKKTMAVCDDLEGDLFLLSGDRYNKITKVKVQKGRAVRGLAFSPDGKTLFAGSANYSDTLRRFDIATNSWSDISKVKNFNFTSNLPITKDSRYLLFKIDNFNANISEDMHQLAIYDLKENRVSSKFKVEQMISRIALNPGNDLFAIGFFDGHVDLFRWNDSLPFFSYRPHNNVIQQIEFSKTRNWIISRADDGLVSIWDFKEKNKVVDLFNVYSADRAYAMVTSENYYMMPPGVIREIHFAKGFQTYSVSQFDLVLNRPDKVLERIGMADASLVEMYKKAIARRMQKNGLDKDAVLKFDELQPLIIEGRSAVPSKTSSSVLPLKLNTSNKEVSEYLLYINNQLVEKAKPSASNSAEFKVALNEGANNIELAYLTKKGIESLHERIEIRFESPTPIVSKRYYIGIGVSAYKDSSRNLRYAAKDVEDIQEKFKKTDTNTIVRLYRNEEVTKQKLAEIKQVLEQSTIHDQVIISFSGHGLLDTAYNFYFATHDMNFEDPASKGFSYAEIESLFDNIPARKKLVLIDACQSGSVERELLSGEDAEIKNDSVKSYSRGGIVAGNQKKSELSSSIKLMQQYFADISKGKGAVVISASAGEENALESAQWKNGVFTYCFIQAVFEGKGDTNRDGHVSVSEVKEYMEKEVLRLTNGRQRPASRKENLEWDWWIR